MHVLTHSFVASAAPALSCGPTAVDTLPASADTSASSSNDSCAGSDAAWRSNAPRAASRAAALSVPPSERYDSMFSEKWSRASTFWVIATLRRRSVASERKRRSEGISVPSTSTLRRMRWRIAQRSTALSGAE